MYPVHPMSAVATPETAAGRAMLADWAERRTHPPTAGREAQYAGAILAIEAEARAQERARLREAVEGLDIDAHAQFDVLDLLGDPTP